MSALVSDGCRRACGSYWNRVTDPAGQHLLAAHVADRHIGQDVMDHHIGRGQPNG